MSATTLYVCNLHSRVSGSHLEKLTAEMGTVKSVSIVEEAKIELSEQRLKKLGLDPTAKLAVIRMRSKNDAIVAAKWLAGQKLFGRELTVLMAGPHGTTFPRPPK
jgi:Fe2+ transport system protein FeoA